MFTADPTLATYRWPVVKLRPGHRTQGVLLSPKFFCVTTHWIDNTILCCVEDCPLCELIPARGLFYIAVLVESRRSLVELGALSAMNLEQHAKLLHGGMKPGQVIEFRRSGAKQPVSSEIVRSVETFDAVSQITLAQRVMSLYKFPPPNPDEALETYEKRIRSIAQVRCSRHAQLLLKSRMIS